MSDYVDSIIKIFEDLARDSSPAAMEELRRRLEIRDGGTYEKHIIPYLACMALLAKGVDGVQVLSELIYAAPGHIYPMAILSSLWSASKGLPNPPVFIEVGASSVLRAPLEMEVQHAARDKFIDFLEDSRSNAEAFSQLISLLYSEQVRSMGEALSKDFHRDCFGILSDMTLRVSDRCLLEYERLIGAEVPEEACQKFFSKNPVVIHPLANNFIDKQRLGDDLVTDFVLETLTGEYIAVEIEKPSDHIFTKGDDFSSKFTHAFGQVIDFLDWIEQNIAYAQRKLPGIIAPRGLLVMGLRSEMSQRQEDKLRRFNKNSNFIQVVTYDNLLRSARALQRNIRHKVVIN